MIFVAHEKENRKVWKNRKKKAKREKRENERKYSLEEQLIFLSVGLICFSKNTNQKLKSESKKLWILTTDLEMIRICKIHFV
jgi:hypothetical protein